MQTEAQPIANKFQLEEDTNGSSFSCGEHSNSTHEINKKRKLLQFEHGNSGLPWRKHKLRDLSGSLNQTDNSPDEVIDAEIDESVASENGSNSLVNDCYDNKISSDMITDTATEEQLVFGQQEPSTSSNSSLSTNRLSKDMLYSLESRSMKNANETMHVNMDATCLDELELQEVINTDDVMLYSNDVPPFLLASRKWSFGSQDARLGSRKPTIDQEFEQYFSSLML